MNEMYSKNEAQWQISLNQSLQKVSRTITISEEYEKSDKRNECQYGHHTI